MGKVRNKPTKLKSVSKKLFYNQKNTARVTHTSINFTVVVTAIK